MDETQNQIELLQAEIRNAQAVIAKAVSTRRAVGKDSPLAADANVAVEAARQALAVVEIKLRALYESKEED